MMLRTETENTLNEAYAHLLAKGLDGAAEALRILVNEASVIERAAYLKVAPFERSTARVDYANVFKKQDQAHAHGTQ
jgi:putative transposase